MGAEADTELVDVRIPSELKALCDAAAASEGRSLGSLIERLLREHVRGATLQDFHAAALHRFEELAFLAYGEPSPPRCFRQLSFGCRPKDGPGIEASQLVQRVRDAMRDVGRGFRGTRLFEAYARPVFAPRFVQVRDGREVLESFLDPRAEPDAQTLEYWCASSTPDGSHLRPYDEDAERSRSPVGAWFSPFLLVRDLVELVTFASRMGEDAGGGGFVEFRCEWWGLAGRCLYDPHADTPWPPGSVAHSDHRLSCGRWLLRDLHDPMDAVAVLAGPVLRLFDPGFDCGRNWISAQTPRFRG